MKLFNFKKKNTTQQNILNETLTKEGDLPFGWTSRNKNFVNRIQGEYTYFLNRWIESRTKSPKEQFAALKSFVLYLEDVEKLCKSKGECHVLWFNEILTEKGYLENRRNELNDFHQNLVKLQDEYEKKLFELEGLEDKVWNKLKENEGILQSEFVKLFDPIVKDEVAKILYYWSKEGKIQRTKSGRSYILHYKE